MKVLIALLLCGGFCQSVFSAEIHQAAKAGDKAKIVALVKGGVDPDLKDRNGNTPFLISVIHGRDLEAFLSSDSSKDSGTLFQQTGKRANLRAKNNKGQAWYHLAVLHCNHIIFSGYSGGADDTDNNGRNIFHYIAESDCSQPYPKLILYTAQGSPGLITRPDRSGLNPLQSAMQSGTKGGKALIEAVIQNASQITL